MYVILLFTLVPILLHIQNLLYGVSQVSILGPVTFLDLKKVIKVTEISGNRYLGPDPLERKRRFQNRNFSI